MGNRLLIKRVVDKLASEGLKCHVEVAPGGLLYLYVDGTGALVPACISAKRHHLCRHEARAARARAQAVRPVEGRAC